MIGPRRGRFRIVEHLRRRLRGRATRRREVEEEIRAHLAMRQEALERAGLPADEARAEALRRFGDVERARETLAASAAARDRALDVAAWLDDRRCDVRLALRRARRAPGFSALAAGTLALGVGLTTAAFAVVDGVLLRPLPYAEPDRLVELWSVAEAGNAFASVSSDSWIEWRDGNRTLEGTALVGREARTLAREQGAIEVAAAVVSGGFFDVLRPGFRAGRAFGDEEAREGAAVAVVSEAFWRDHLGEGPLPARVTLDHQPRDVIGVVPSGTYPGETDVWLPSAPRAYGFAGAHNWINFVALGRLAPGVEPQRARDDLSAIARGIRERDPDARYAFGVGVVPLREAMVGDLPGRLVLLLGAAGLVLLIACINLAGLGLARSAVRAPELAVRSALGAERRRIVGQLLTEHLLLGLAGGVLGAGLAWAGVRTVTKVGASFVPGLERVGMDGRVLLFSLAACVASALLAGVLPSWRAGRHAAGVAATARGAVGGGLTRGGASLVAAQVGLALTLLIGGALLVRSLSTVLGREVGFDPDGVLVAEVTLDAPAYRLEGRGGREGAGFERRLAYWRELLAELRTLPDVTAVGLSSGVPTGTAGTSFLEVEGRPYDPADGAGYRAVSPGYFEALGIPLLAGRDFGAEDGPATERVVVVNQLMARRYWGAESPLGRRVRAPSMESPGDPAAAEWLTVVGVVGDVRQFGYEREAMPEMFVLYEQVPVWTGFQNVVARGPEGRSDRVADALRAVTRDLDPSLAVGVATLEARMGAWTRERRFLTGLLTGYAAAALALALVGVYGLLAFVVARRVREMGVRAALGATRAGLLRLVLTQGLRVAGAGAAAGLLAALVLTRVLESLLVEITPTDPATFGLCTLLTLGAAAVAALVPARRAARVDPLVALRQEG
jgi:predicted permease